MGELRPLAVTIVAHEVTAVGGQELAMQQLISGLLERGYAVTLIARRCELPPHPRLRHVGVPGPDRPFVLAYPWFFLIGGLLTYRRRSGRLHTLGAIVPNRVDLATVQFCHLALPLAQAVRRGRRPTPGYWLNALLVALLGRAAERWCYRESRARRLVAVSQGVAAELREHLGRTEGSLRVIPNGVDHARFRPDAASREAIRSELGIGAEDLVAVFVGGDWDRKGLRFAIEALAGAPGWRLIVVGPGDERTYGRIARQAGVSDCVSFVGRRRDAARYYAAADVFLQPTVYETFSIATYEAAASGLPLLVGRVSGVEDILVDGRNGWFVPRDPSSIAERLARLGADPALRRTMAEEARSAVATYGWDSVVESYVDLYAALGPAARPH